MRLFFGGIAGLAISRETAAAVFTASRHSVRHRDITLADLAGVACLSPFHFSRTFARAMGVSPHRYVSGSVWRARWQKWQEASCRWHRSR
jgi:AraC-like DNA-binding protein